MVSNVDHRPKVVLIASALPGEGKSSLAVALARQSALAALNGKVMLIDCDLRRPTVSGLLGLRAEAGITELFSGEASFNEVIRTDPKTGLHVLPAVPGTPNPPELLNSQHMRSLLDKLSQSYDLIVLDSPALESVSDARVLAHLADATIFVVQAETTPRQKAIAALRQLAHAHAHMAGVVLSRVNLRRQQKYEHRDAGAA
jgi:capsular exopolysaccharide synthesis family protein